MYHLTFGKHIENVLSSYDLQKDLSQAYTFTKPGIELQNSMFGILCFPSAFL